MFETEEEDIGLHENLSKYYYELTDHASEHFLVTADIYPELVTIFDESKNNSAVFNKIESDNPNFDWSKYDNRTNFPNWLSDNSTSSPDFKVDYAVVIWRDIGGGSGQADMSGGTVTTSFSGSSVPTE